MTATGTEARLARLRGRALPKSHNARTIAALASNPGCARRAIMDAAGADKQRIAAYAGFPAPFGQSRFALARGNAFEAQVKADGAAQLLNLPIPQAHYADLGEVGGNASLDLRHARTKTLLARAATSQDDAGTMFDHPLLRLQVGGRYAFLEPDLTAFQLHGTFRIVEIKSFAVIDGQADADKVAAAAIQSAVYVLALRDALAEQDIPPEKVSHETILVCPENFANKPVATSLDVRKQLTVLRRQFARMDRIDGLLGLLPPDLTFDLDPDGNGVPQRSPADLAAAIRHVEARYAPECLSTCEMCFFCRDEARGCTAALGRDARPALALDLAEEFRPLLADSTVLTCVNNREVGPSDFLVRAGAVTLTDGGRKTVIRAWERRMTTQVRHPLFGYQVSYRRAVELQARILAARLTGELAVYSPLVTR